MQVRLTRDYTARPEWSQLPYRAGLIVTGPLAAMALQDGAGVILGLELENKVVAAPEVKAPARPRGRPRKEEGDSHGAP